MNSTRSQHGFTLLELLVVITIIAVLAGLFMPQVGVARDAARKQTCNNNIRLLGLAELQYEQTYRRLSCLNMTWGYGGYSGIPFWDIAPGYDGAGRWSGLIALLPYTNNVELHKEFQEGTAGYWQSNYLAWGPYGSVASSAFAKRQWASADSLRYPWSIEYKLNRTQALTFRCPSDIPKIKRSLASSNYAFCLGDGQIGVNGVDLVESQTRGAFQRNHNYSLSDISDGLANTIAFGEIASPETTSIGIKDKGTMEKDAKVQGKAVYELDHQPDLKGINVTQCRTMSAGSRYPGNKRNWSNLGIRNFDALANYTGFNTINAPNAGSCTPTSDPWGEGEGIYTATSYHFGGVHVVTFDGSVLFIYDGISVQDNRIDVTSADCYAPGRQWLNGQWQQTSNWSQESPFGIWGALGNRAGNDSPGNGRPAF